MTEEIENKEKDLTNREELAAGIEAHFQAEDYPEPEVKEPVSQPAEESTEPEVEEKPTEPEVEEKQVEDIQMPTEDELSDLPESNPKPDDWKRMRDRNKELKAQIKALKTQEREVPLESVPESKSKEKYSADFLVDVLRQVEEGELDDSYKFEAAAELSEKSPSELMEVIKKARSNFYGEKSAEVEDIARRYLPEVQASWETVREKQRQAQQSESVRNNSWKEVFEKTPQLQDKNSQVYSEFKEASGVLNQYFPDLWQKPNAPSIISEFVTMRSQAMSGETIAKENATLKARVQTLEKQLGTIQAPPSQGRAPNIDGNVKKSNKQELIEGLASLGVNRS